MTRCASWFPWAIYVLRYEIINTSLLYWLQLVEDSCLFPPWNWPLIAGDEKWGIGSPSIFMCSLHLQWRAQAIPEFPFAALFHEAQQHDEQSSDAPPAPWSQVSTPACHNVCHTLLLVQVPSKLLTPTLREEVMWVRKNGAEVHPLGTVSRVPPLATLCAYTCNSVLIILGVNMSCVLLNELVTRSIFTWRISEKKASDSKRKHQSYFGGKLLEVLYNMSQLTSSLCLPCREDMIGLGVLYLLWI